ncbi:MAG: cytochrome-c peroxidase [Anaerolineae bacterium]
MTQKAGFLLILFAGIATCGALLFSSRDVMGQVTEQVPQLPATHYNYANPDLPNYFERGRVDNTDNTPNNNPVTDAGATLGRVLFYDVKLSANDTTSCASCHQAEAGFSDPRPLSVGFDGGLTGRNSMGLANARYYNNGAFFWDERAATLEDQVLMPIQDTVEMGMDLDTLKTKLAATDYYGPLFEDAFGDETITDERISLALAQFVRSMVSYQSKFDVGEQSNFDNFTAAEERGRELFDGRATCGRCHTTEVQVADEPRNNGVDDGNNDDNGVGGANGNAADNGKFKTPSLRNIALTGPYMHDGRFETLEQVLQFYDNGIQDHPNLDPILQTPNGNPRRLNLDGGDRADLIAFLNTLTDPTFLGDPKFADPFVDAIEVTPVPATPTPVATSTPIPTPAIPLDEAIFLPLILK